MMSEEYKNLIDNLNKDLTKSRKEKEAAFKLAEKLKIDLTPPVFQPKITTSSVEKKN